VISPNMLLQIMPYIGQFAGAAVGGEKGKRIAETSAAFGELLGMTGKITKAFGSPNIGTDNGLGISNYKDFKGALTKDYGAFNGALPKGGNFNLPKDMIGGGFGLKIPKGWNAPESIFNPPGGTKPFDWSL